jgi:hypothetical protein
VTLAVPAQIWMVSPFRDTGELAKADEQRAQGKGHRLNFANGLQEVGRRDTSMSALKWLLMLVGAAAFGSAGALVAYDIYLAEQLRRLLSRGKVNESGKKLIVRAPRSSVRKSLIWRPNLLSSSAGQGFR